MLARCGNAPPMQRNWTRHWMKPVEWSQDVWSRQIPTVCPYSPESPPSDIRRAVASRTERTRQATDERHPLNGHLGVVPRLKSRKSFMTCTIQSTRLRKLPAWSYGENDSSPWTPECILTSVLTNNSQLAQRIPGQPGRHSTGCVRRLAGPEWTCWSGDFPTNQKPMTMSSGRPCNTYWSAPWWTLPALPKTWQRLTTSPSAVPGIGGGGGAQFDGHNTTPGGRTRMMMRQWAQ